MSHINNKELLVALLDGPYSDFKEIGQDDWRDPRDKNAGFSLSTKGFCDHKTGESGNLYNLAEKHNLSILNNHHPASYSQSSTQLKKSSAVDVQRIWEQSRIVDQP